MRNAVIPGRQVQRGVAEMTFGIDTVFSWLRRSWPWIVLAVMLGAAAGGFLSRILLPRYTVYTDTMIPPTNVQLLPTDLSPSNQQTDSQILDIESRILLLNSGNVLRRVVDTLHLADVPEFNGTEPLAPLDPRVFIAKPRVPQDEASRTATAMRTVASRVKVERQARSYVITIAVWARTPEMALALAQALNTAFQDELTRSQVEVADQAAATLGKRLADLKREAGDAEERMAVFRETNDLQTSSGELVSSQSMTSINGRLQEARGALLQAQSRYEQMRGERNPADPSGSLRSPTLSTLRANYSDLKQRRGQLSETLGPRHPGLRNIDNQIGLLEDDMRREVQRVLDEARSGVAQAQALVDGLETQMAGARNSVSMDNVAQVKLRELARDVAAKTALYETFLKRVGETAELGQISVSNVRVISAPMLPDSRTFPPKSVVLIAGGAAGGLCVGLGLAVAIGFLGDFRRARRVAV